MEQAVCALSDDNPRKTIQLQRRLLVDAMLLGVVLAKEGDAAKIREELEPKDMITASGQLLLESIVSQDRKRFASLLRRRFGIDLLPDKTVAESLLSHAKRSNAVMAALDMSEILLHEIRNANTLEDIEDRWAEGLQAIKRANN